MRIELKDLELHGRHGVLPEEKERGQRFVVDVRLEPRSARAEASDDLVDTVDYREVVAIVEEVVGRRVFDLLEAVAATLADELLAKLPVRWAEVTVRKPEVRLALPVAYAAVTVERYAETASE